jgi:CubicO group peptidase (beta-lactamase class C family)
VLEKYFDSFTQDSFWYYASAGKSVMAFLIGMAQEEGLLDINMPTSTYLGQGWTVAPPAKEDLITVWHQLSMTTGLDDRIAPTPQIPAPLDCLDDSCLQYLTDAGTRWAYHNAPYRLLQDVLENASNLTKNQFTNTRLLQRTGMKGLWVNYIFYGKARDMARFGHLVLSNGVWNGDTLLGDTAYLQAMSRSSQTMNESYGLLWWLNGKPSHLLPGLQLRFGGSLIPNGPADMFAALGKNDQKIYVIPSQDMVVIRQGNNAGNVALASSSFDNELWRKINELTCPTTGLASELETNDLVIYPQPARDVLWIQAKGQWIAPQARLISMDGKAFLRQVQSLSGNKISISLEGLTSGLYVLQIQAEGEFIQQKISVQD